MVFVPLPAIEPLWDTVLGMGCNRKDRTEKAHRPVKQESVWPGVQDLRWESSSGGQSRCRKHRQAGSSMSWRNLVCLVKPGLQGQAWQRPIPTTRHLGASVPEVPAQPAPPCLTSPPAIFLGLVSDQKQLVVPCDSWHRGATSSALRGTLEDNVRFRESTQGQTA